MSGRLTRQKDEPTASRLLMGLSRRLSAVVYNSSLHHWRLKGKHPVRLEVSPNDPSPGTLSRGARIINGEWQFAGHTLQLEDPTAWPDLSAAPDLFKDWFIGFGWLNDLAQVADHKRAQERAEALTSAFIDTYARWHHYAWRPDLLGTRIQSWVLHAPLILSSSNLVYRSAVLTSLVHQARHLNHAIDHAGPGAPTCRAGVGLALSGLLLPDGKSRLAKAYRTLEAELGNFINPDGGVESRNPRDAQEILTMLVLLKSCLLELNKDVPDWVQTSCDKLVPFLRAMTHGDGGFAQLGGAYQSDALGLQELIELSGAKGRAISNLPFTGYQRLKHQRTNIIVDVGPPPRSILSTCQPASTMGFELCDGKHRIVVGLGGVRPGWAPSDFQVQVKNRQTSSSSAIELGGENISPLQNLDPLKHKDMNVLFERNENENGTWVDANHDGYLDRFGTQHFRRFYLNSEGSDFRGEDTLIREAVPKWKFWANKEPVEAALRFHLHPDVSISQTGHAGEVIMRLPGGHGWSFMAMGGVPGIEESVYSDAPGKTRGTQTLVLRHKIKLGEKITFKWAFKRLD